MKRIIVLLTIAAALYSCGREDYFYQNDATPVVGLSKNNIEFSAEIKDTVKLNMAVSYYIKSSDAQQTSLGFSQENNDSVYIDGNRVTVVGKTVGDNKITVMCSDIYGKSGESYLNLNVFSNQLPVAQVNAKKIANIDPYEVEIDASSSFDRDAKFGGKVVLYEYTLKEGYSFTTVLSKIKYIYQNGGQKSITLKVLDNDGQWSESAVAYIIL